MALFFMAGGSDIQTALFGNQIHLIVPGDTSQATLEEGLKRLGFSHASIERIPPHSKTFSSPAPEAKRHEK